MAFTETVIIKQLEEAHERLAERTAQAERVNAALRQEISELKRAEEERARFFTLSLDMRCVVRLNDYFKQLNPAWERTIGFTQEELKAKPLIEFVHPEDREATIRAIQKVRDGIDAIAFESRFRCKDGSYKWLLWSATKSPDASMVYAVTHDITGRKQAEEALRISEERFALAVGGTNDGIWDWDPLTNEVFYSARWKEMLGYEESEIGNDLDEWKTQVHPDDLDQVMQAVDQHFTHRTPFYVAEHRVLCKDGTYKWILGRAHAQWDETDNVVRVVGSHTDITERKQIEEALCESEARFRSLAVSSPVGIYLTDVTGACLYTNPRWQEIAGKTLEESLGAGWIQGIASEEREAVATEWQACVQAGRGFSSEFLCRRSAEDVRWAHSRAAAVRAATGSVSGYVGTLQDITDRKQAEAQLERQTQELVHANSELTLRVRPNYAAVLNIAESGASRS